MNGAMNGLDRRLLGAVGACAVVALAGSWVTSVQAEDSPEVSGVNCSFRSDPDEFLAAQSRTREGIYLRTGKFQNAAAVNPARTVAAASIPKRNFIDDEIFGKLTQLGVPSAELSTDQEFVRRIYLDLTGRIPTPDQIREFLADSSTDKRERLIDRLLFTPEFGDKWTNWFGDLLQNNRAASTVSRQVQGRNTYHDWIRASVHDQKSIRDMAWELVTAGGNVYDGPAGAANFIVGARVTAGPVEDTYDMMLVKTATAFLGLGYYDCLLCHDGRGHLDLLSAWGKAGRRYDAQRMAAFFSKTRLRQPYNREVREHPYYNSWEVYEVPTSAYSISTNFGNRPNRIPLPGNVRTIAPEYRETAAKPSSSEWRVAFADNLVKDPMFARNMVNRLWKAMFNMGLVDPVDTMDPDRLDPKKAPPEGWSLQATHPVLLEKLAEVFVQNNFNLRETLRLMALSSAYQLSSRYSGEWKLDYVPLFARRYIRRLEGEEVHDAIAMATGIRGNYTVQGWDANDRVEWAIKLPDTLEPASNGAVANFMNNFIRGNRDTQARNQAGSIQQQLALMNDNVVISRIGNPGTTNSPVLRGIVGTQSNEQAVEELFLRFLSRQPTEAERTKAIEHLTKMGASGRTTAIQDLAWACINKSDFLFSY